MLCLFYHFLRMHRKEQMHGKLCKIPFLFVGQQHPVVVQLLAAQFPI